MNPDVEMWLPPDTPDAFESLCLDLWREIWQIPVTQKIGRYGQGQNGVDIYGTTERGEVGIQCKQKSRLLKSRLTTAELREAISDARRFSPPLYHLIIATTAPRDAKLQEEVRVLSKANVSEGYFSVSLWSWQDIWEALATMPNLLKRIARRYWPVTSEALPTIPKLSSSRLPMRHDTGVFRGREEALCTLNNAWSTSTINVITIVALGGAGKSTLVARWTRSLLEFPEHSGIEKYFDWSFYNQGGRPDSRGIPAPISSDLFIDEALKSFGDEAMAASKLSRRAKGERLAELVGQQRSLLILDGLEALQIPTANRAETELNDFGLQALLGTLALINRGLCVITTRESVLDLQRWKTTTCPELELTALCDSAGAAVLRDLGVVGTDEELKNASAEVKGHALTLSLMGRYLATAFYSFPHISRKDCFGFRIADATIQNGHAFRVISTYDKWMNSNGKTVELAILQMLSLFDGPATADCLNALILAPDLKLSEPLRGISQQKWNISCKWLEQFHLADLRHPLIIDIFGYDEDFANEASFAIANCVGFHFPAPESFFREVPLAVNTDALDTHPLIREYFQTTISEANLVQGHDLLFTHLCQQTPYWPDNKEGLQVLYQAVKHGSRANRAEESFEVCRKRIWRNDDFFGVKRLGDVDSDLELMWCFFETPWTEVMPTLSVSTRTMVLHVAGFSLRATGRLLDALLPLEQAENRYLEAVKWLDAADVAANLNAILLVLGNAPRALYYAKRAIQWADNSGNSASRWLRRAECAYTILQMGQVGRAAQLFHEAQTLQAFQDSRPELFSSSIYYYAQFLFYEIDCGCADKKEPFLEKLNTMIAMSSKLRTTSVRDEAFLDLLLAGLHIRLFGLTGSDEVLAIAMGHADLSLEKLRLSHRTDLLPLGFLIRAEVLLCQQHWDATVKDVARAEQIAKSRSMPLYLLIAKKLRIAMIYSKILQAGSVTPELRAEGLCELASAKQLTVEFGAMQDCFAFVSRALVAALQNY